MLKTIAGSFFRVLTSPSFLLAGLLLVLLQAGIFSVFFIFNDVLPRFYYELFVLNIFPDAGFLETVFLLVAANLEEFVFLAAAVTLWIGASYWMVFSFAQSLSKNESPVKSAGDGLKHLGKIFGLAVFTGIVLVLFSVVLLFFAWLLILGGLAGTFGGIGIAGWILVGAFLYFKLLFLPVEFFSKQEKISSAIKSVWKWSSKRFFSIIAFVFLVFVVSNLTLAAGIFVSDLVPFEALSILIVALSLAFSSSFFGLALVDYYFSNK